MPTHSYSIIPPDVDEVVVNWSSGVVKTNVGDATDSFVSDVIRNGKDSERARKQANDILGKSFIPPKGFPPVITQRVRDLKNRFEVENRKEIEKRKRNSSACNEQSSIATDEFGRQSFRQTKSCLSKSNEVASKNWP